LKSDKDRPSTWKPYREGLCQSCTGACCTMPVEVRSEDLLRLKLINEDELHASKKKIFKRLKVQGYLQSYRESTQLFMLQSKPSGECVFLDSTTRKCSVYAIRPEVCRDFPLVGPRIHWCPYTKT
jgi:uncharacterized protein